MRLFPICQEISYEQRVENLPKIAPGVIHKPHGQNFEYFDPPPPSWSLLLNKAYVIKWSFGYPPPHQLSTWFMNDPLQQNIMESIFAFQKAKAIECHFQP